MTVGERIQKYRKNLGMSQEELGQKLMVSRQTISLWEKDQTFPTVDNLIRLKEIFGVSVDEILDGESEQSVPEVQPEEIYRFQYSKTELQQIHKLQRRRLLKKPIIFLAFCIFQVFYLEVTSAPDSLIGFAWGILFISLMNCIIGIRRHKKYWKHSLGQVSESVYEYQFFQDYILIRIYYHNEMIRQSKCYYTDIEEIHQTAKWLLVQFGGQVFIIRREELTADSLFCSFIRQNPRKTKGISASIWNIISWSLFVASLLSIYGALCLVDVVMETRGDSVENLWVFFLMTPFPIASFVVGIVLKAKKRRHLKNIIVGIIVTVILCSFGSFTFIFAGDHSDEPIIRTEQTLGIDIPEHKHIRTEDWTKGTQSGMRGYTHSISDIYFEDNSVAEFEKQLIQDEKWLTDIPSTLIGITSSHTEFTSYDCIMIYNTDSSQYNSLPDNNGTYHFINILYHRKSNHMQIIEYDIEYVR